MEKRKYPELTSWTVMDQRYEKLETTFHTVKVFKSDEDLQRVLELDNLAFRGQVGIDFEYLKQIRDKGFIFGIEEDGELVAQAQLVCESIPDAPEMGVQALPKKCAYFEGLATHPRAKGKGYGRGLILAAEEALHFLEKDYTFILTTTRLENVSSLKAFTGVGYAGIGVMPQYYPSHNHRVLLAKNVAQSRAYWREPVFDGFALDQQKRLIVETDLEGYDYRAYHLAYCATTHQGRALTSVELSKDHPERFTAVFSPVETWRFEGLEPTDKLFGSCVKDLKSVRECSCWNNIERWPLISEMKKSDYQAHPYHNAVLRYWGSRAAVAQLARTNPQAYDTWVINGGQRLEQ